MVTTHGCIEADKDNIRDEPYSLPQGFVWDALDLGDSAVVSCVCVCACVSTCYFIETFIKYFCMCLVSPVLSWRSCTLFWMRTMWRTMITCSALTTHPSSCFGVFILIFYHCRLCAGSKYVLKGFTYEIPGKKSRTQPCEICQTQIIPFVRMPCVTVCPKTTNTVVMCPTNTIKYKLKKTQNVHKGTGFLTG